MSKKLLSVLAAVLIAGMVVPAFAAVENVKVGGDITAYGVYRNNFDFTEDSVAKDQAHFFQTSARLFVSAALSDNVTAMVRLVNERAWGQNNDGGAGIALDLAYVKLADLMAPGVNLTVGRQELKIGEGFVVGSAYQAAGYNVNSALVANDLGVQKAFDAVKLDYAMSGVPISFQGFMSKINEAVGGNGTQDATLYGVSMLWNPGNFTLEPYFVAQYLAGAPSAADFDMSVLGARASGGIPAVAGMNWKAEFAMQMGDVVGVDLNGWAGYIGAGYKIDSPAAPSITLGYNYYTGWDTAAGTDVDAWVPVYPSDVSSRIGKIAYAAIFPVGEAFPTGLQAIKLGFGIKPTEKIALTLDAYNLRVNELPVGSTVGKTLGNEIDLGISYQYTEDVALGLDLGYFLSGSMIDDLLTPNSTNAWQAVASLKIGF